MRDDTSKWWPGGKVPYTLDDAYSECIFYYYSSNVPMFMIDQT